jgi:ribosomal protein S18 acetylase RimI-like enzyme
MHEVVWVVTVACCRCKTVHLLVDVERRAARALYDSEGFQTLSTRKDYYREGRDALWMELAL